MIESKKGLQPHEIRVVEERTELVDKITKLHAFMASDFYETLDSTSQDYFEQQEVAMKNYADVLLYRINRFEGKMEDTVIPLTYGEQLVGLTFNPSGDERVIKAKKLMAQTIDLVEEAHNERTDGGNIVCSRETATFRTNAVVETVTAQMAIVKYLTWKH
jgi:hypothetical protein